MSAPTDLQSYAAHLAGDPHHRLDTLRTMAEHAGACEALLAAMTLLRRLGHRDAADVLLANVSALVKIDPPAIDEDAPAEQELTA